MNLLLDLSVRYWQHFLFSGSDKVGIVVTTCDFHEFCIPSLLREALRVDVSSIFIDADLLQFCYLSEESRIWE